MVLGALASVDDFGGPGNQAQQVPVHQRVIDHDVRAAEQLGATQGEEAGITRPGAHQINHACRLHARGILGGKGGSCNGTGALGRWGAGPG